MMLALLAAVCMVAQDMLGVIMVQAEARNRDWLSGFGDFLGWPIGMVTTVVTVTALQGNNTHEKVLVIVVVSAANLFGTVAAVRLGKRYVKDSSATILELRARIEALEAA